MTALASGPALGQSDSQKSQVLNGHLVWVMPFQNNSAQSGLDWIGASFPDILNHRLSSAGFLTIRREDRRYALAHLGLPVDFHPTQATTYRIAQTLDADYIVFGKYTVANGRITASARLLAMNGPRMSAAIEEEGSLDQMIDVEDELAWKVGMAIDPSLHLDEKTFVAAGRNLRLDAFENYIRGVVEPGADERIGHLNKAVQLSPDYIQAWFALGKAYFEDQQYEQAEVPFSKVPKGSRLWLEAMFYAGLGHLYTGDYSSAQSEFSAIAAVLPMPEVLNNEGVAINRRGQNGTALFQRTVQLDPQSPDYWFNLAVSERRVKNYSAALKAVDRSLALRPQDEETLQLKRNLTLLKDGGAVRKASTEATKMQPPGAPIQPQGVATDAKSDSPQDAHQTTAQQEQDPAGTVPENSNAEPAQEYEPLERIARAYNESSFRQAAFEMEQMSALKLRSMPAPARARLLSEEGTKYVNDGLLLEAERQFQLAVAADPASAEGHAGLAAVHEYAGSAKLAQQEAAESIAEKPNVPAYLVLARIDLAQRSYAEAQKNVDQALAIDPANSAAKGIQQSIQSQQSSR